MAPVSRLTHMLGTCVFAMLHGILMTIVQLLVLAPVLPSRSLARQLGCGAVLLLVGSVSLIGLGIISAMLPLLFTERGAQMAYIIRAVLLLVSGVYYPVSVLPPWLRWMSAISPVTYLLEGLRKSIQTGAGLVELWPDVWPLLVSGIALVPLGLWIFARAERYAKRTGKLKRNG